MPAEDQQLQAQGQQAVANPPRAVGPNRSNVIDGQFSTVEPQVSTVNVTAGKAQAEAAPEKASGPKIGAGHLGAMWRVGLKELAAALPAFNNGQQIQDDPALAGNITQQQANQAKGVKAESLYGKSADQGATQEPKQTGSVYGDFERKPNLPPPSSGHEQTQSHGRGR
jgi:hypothetical protein